MGRDGRGPYTLDATAVAAAFAQHGADLPVDYEHQMLTASQKSGPVPAAGWITAVQAKEDGLWGRVQWTAQAAQLLKDRAYRYVSAVFDHMPDGRVIRLKGAGLVHAPNLPLQAAASQQVTPATPTIPPHSNGATRMNLEQALAEVQRLSTALTAAETTVAAQSQQIATLTQTAAQSAQATPDPTKWVPAAQYQLVCAQLTTAQQSQAQSAVDEAVTAAMSQGKVAPALKDWATAYASQDLAGFKAFVSSSPVIVSAQGQITPPTGAAVTTAAQALNDSDREVAKLLGLPIDAMAAQKAAAR